VRKLKVPAHHAAVFAFGGSATSPGSLCRPGAVFYLFEKTDDPQRVTCKTCLRIIDARRIARD
jgi:hypothetical protein